MDNIMTVRLHEVGKVSASVKDAVVVEKDVPGVGVPPGGASGQVLTKLSGADYDTGWRAAIGGGENDHGKLTNRDAQDQHPIGAIAGLAEALAGKQPKGDYLTADKLQSATDAALAQAKASGAFDGAPGKDAATDISLGIAGAQVGQIAKITAVDEAGKPTSWEPVDMPSGEEKWEKIAEIELRTDTAEYVLADFATWRKAKVIMTRSQYVSGLSKNVWCKVAGKDSHDTHSCGYLTMGYGYIFWEFYAEVDELFIASSHIETNNRNAPANVTSAGTFFPLASPVGTYKFKLQFVDTSVIQAGDKVTVIGVRR